MSAGDSPVVAVERHRVLELDDVAWLVEAGTFAVFAATGGREDSGRRRFVHDAGPGAVLLGPATDGEAPLRLRAIALDDARLRRVPAAELAARADLIEAWLAPLRAGLSGRGDESDGPDELAPDAVVDVPRRRVALARALRRFEDALRAAERDRQQAREASSAAASDFALRDLVSVVRPAGTPGGAGPPLLEAARLVAAASGVDVVAPPAWESRSRRVHPVEAIARASRFRARRVVLEDGWWRRDGGPLLATAADGGPVALLPVAPGRYRAVDPRDGEPRPVDETVAAGIDRRAWVFHRPLPVDAGTARGLVRFALRGRGRDVWQVALTAVAATVLGMLTPPAVALLVDGAIPDADVTMLLQIAAALLAAAFGAAVFRLSQNVALTRIEVGADAETQAAVWDRLLRLRLSFFRRFTSGDLQSRVTAIGQIRAVVSGTTLRSLFGAVVLLLNLVLLLWYSPALTLIALAVAAAVALVTVAIGIAIVRCTRRMLELRGDFYGLMVQLIQGIAKLRVAGAEERAYANWARRFAELIRLELRERHLRDGLQLTTTGLSIFGVVALFVAAAALLGRDGVVAGSTGAFLAFYVAYGTFLAAVAQLGATVSDVLVVGILRERALPILTAAPESDESKVDPGPLRGDIRIDSVVFRYRDGGPAILDRVDVAARSGEFVAFVGPSGSGKSTLFRVLLGFETPEAGAVYYDGQDLSGLDVQAVRRQLGVVLQGGRINAGSIFDNIVANADLGLDDAWRAARATGFAQDVEALPMGMHTIVSEGGGNLSGGQRQRLLLSRALVHEPRVLLLDEATSALDNRTQAIVGESLARLDVTRLVIAHRLSTVRDADRIYVIDGGRVVQQGAFDELAESPGPFRDLMLRQRA